MHKFYDAWDKAIRALSFEPNVMKRSRRHHDLAVKICEKMHVELKGARVETTLKHGNVETREKHDKPHGSGQRLHLTWVGENTFSSYRPKKKANEQK